MIRSRHKLCPYCCGFCDLIIKICLQCEMNLHDHDNCEACGNYLSRSWTQYCGWCRHMIPTVRLTRSQIEAQTEKERAEKEQAEKERAAKERAERQRAEKERAEKEQAAKEQAEKEQAEKEQAEKERAERQRTERQGAELEQAERDQSWAYIIDKAERLYRLLDNVKELIILLLLRDNELSIDDLIGMLKSQIAIDFSSILISGKRIPLGSRLQDLVRLYTTSVSGDILFRNREEIISSILNLGSVAGLTRKLIEEMINEQDRSLSNDDDNKLTDSSFDSIYDYYQFPAGFLICEHTTGHTLNKLIEIKGNTNILEVKKSLELKSTRSIFSTDHQRNQIRKAIKHFDDSINSWRDGKRQDPRAQWLWTGNSVDFDNVPDIDGYPGSGKWRPYMSARLGNLLKALSTGDWLKLRGFLDRLYVTQGGTRRDDEHTGPWNADFPESLKALPIDVLRHFDETRELGRLISRLHLNYCNNVGHLTILDDRAYQFAQTSTVATFSQLLQNVTRISSSERQIDDEVSDSRVIEFEGQKFSGHLKSVRYKGRFSYKSRVIAGDVYVPKPLFDASPETFPNNIKMELSEFTSDSCWAFVLNDDTINYYKYDSEKDYSKLYLPKKLLGADAPNKKIYLSLQ